jgi:5'-3' exonuclease
VFIFDGAPPPEKHELLKQRKEKKIAAESEYNKVKRRLDAAEDDDDRNELHDELAALKKKFVRLRPTDIEKVKHLLKLCGVTYYEADGEADVLCAKLALKKRVWACMSEDMDMFVYGCPRVLRYLSLLNASVVMYDTKAILETLRLTQKEFKEICIVSGTDYNLDLSRATNLFATLKHFSKYKKSTQQLEFYQWLDENTNYVTDYCRLCSTYFMFDLNNVDLDPYDCHRIMNGPMNRHELHIFLEKFNFIFLD